MIIQQEIRFDSLMNEYRQIWKDKSDLKLVVVNLVERIENKNHKLKEKDIQIDLYRDLSVNHRKESMGWRRRFRHARLGKNILIAGAAALIGRSIYKSFK